jgi:plastocyanin
LLKGCLKFLSIIGRQLTAEIAQEGAVKSVSEVNPESERRKPAATLPAKVVVGLSGSSRMQAPIVGGTGIANQRQATMKARPFAIWVIVAGLVFSGMDLLYGISPDLLNASAFDIFFVPLVIGFVILCFVASLGSLKQRRWGYLLSIVVSLGFALPSLTVIVPTASNPMDFATFAIAISSVPILLLVAVFSILCLMNAKKGLFRKRYLSSARSAGGIVTVAVLLLVIGGLLGGAVQVLAGGSDGRSLSPVSIVLGASNPQNNAGHYDPSTITVFIGVNNTITWTNHDLSLHTVTSDAGSFDSGLLNSGDSWTHTFKTPGTYSYHCTIHPYMTGKIVVLQKT